MTLRFSSRPKHTVPFVLLVVFAMLGLASVIAADPPVNGWTATRADFGWNGERLGTFRQTSDTTWEEVPASSNGNSFQFDETHRDEWSIYLLDRSRDVRLQIDLHTRKVYYSDSNTPRREQYQVLSSSSKVNGWLVKRADFGWNGERLGTFQQTGGKAWAEVPAARDGNRFHFEETHRDEWSVYLLDRSRNVRIQVDLHTRKVYYSDPNTPRREQYQVLDAWSKRS